MSKRVDRIVRELQAQARRDYEHQHSPEVQTETRAAMGQAHVDGNAAAAGWRGRIGGAR